MNPKMLTKIRCCRVECNIYHLGKFLPSFSRGRLNSDGVSRPKTNQPRVKHFGNDVIVLDSDSDEKSSVQSGSRKRRLNNASSSPNKRRSISDNASDCEIIEQPVVLVSRGMLPRLV